VDAFELDLETFFFSFGLVHHVEVREGTYDGGRLSVSGERRQEERAHRCDAK
jgi:hypothetical protein